MKPVTVLLLVAFVLGVESQNKKARTFVLSPSHSESQDHPDHHTQAGNMHGNHAGQTQAHNHALSAHIVQVHPISTHSHPGLAIADHHSNSGHENQHAHHPSSPATEVPGSSNARTVLVCRLVEVPVTPALPASPNSGGGSFLPPLAFGNISSSLDTVVGRVVDPVVALLHNASVWLNRTAHRQPDRGSHVHKRQHYSSVSAVDAMHQEVMKLKKRKNPTLPRPGLTPEPHVLTTASPARVSTAAATSTTVPGRAVTTAATTEKPVPPQVFPSTVGAPVPSAMSTTSSRTPSMVVLGASAPPTVVPSQSVVPPANHSVSQR